MVCGCSRFEVVLRVVLMRVLMICFLVMFIELMFLVVVFVSSSMSGVMNMRVSV